MAKDKDKGKHRREPKERKRDRAAASDALSDHAAGAADAADAERVAGGQHHAAQAHGEALRVDASLPATRAELLVLHAAARKRRNTAELGSDAHRAAVTDLERIEVRVAAIERAQDPPLR
jgi:hypothetical protein